MTTVNRSFCLMIAVLMLFLVQGCNLPVSQPAVSAPVITEPSFTLLPPSSTFSPPPNPISSSTFTPTFTPTVTLTYTPTNTPLPPMPDFGQSLSFGGGGGCDRCGVGYCFSNQNPALRPSVFGTSINEWGDPSERTGFLCLNGIKQGLPFSVRIVSPDGQIVLGSDFIYQNGALSWDGNFVPIDPQGWSQVGDGLINAELPILWPVGVPIGKWQIYSDGAGLQAQGILDDTRIIGDEVNRLQEISIIDPLSQSRILPAGHQFVPKTDTGGLDITGSGFAPTGLAYILIYQSIGSNGESYDLMWDLKSKMSVVADHRGFISAEIPGPFYDGQTYMVISVSNPARLLDATNSKFNNNDDGIGYEVFQVAHPFSSQPGSSCPGAPPQRMIVNQRGYVCTRSDAVRVRASPARSANTLVQIQPGTQFTVIGGPSCSDNWSWWNVRLDDGTTGWVAEGGDEVDPYFICPMP